MQKETDPENLALIARNYHWWTCRYGNVEGTGYLKLGPVTVMWFAFPDPDVPIPHWAWQWSVLGRYYSSVHAYKRATREAR